MKPVTEHIRPQITRLPELNFWRRLVRKCLRLWVRWMVWLFLDATIYGQENYPSSGAVLVVSNHLGDTDAVLGIAVSPRPLELLAKAELYDLPILGWLMQQYGVIWIHRGQPDRRALKAALEALNQGRLVCIAPEARESLSGALEEGTQGAAYLAYKSNAQLLPVTFTGTENKRVYSNLKQLRKTPVTMTIGKPFYLESQTDWRSAIDAGTEQIMLRLALQLPDQYQGVYRSKMEKPHERG